MMNNEMRVRTVDERKYNIILDNIFMEQGYIGFSYVLITDYMGHNIMLTKGKVNVPHLAETIGGDLLKADLEKSLGDILNIMISDELIRECWDRLKDVVAEGYVNAQEQARPNPPGTGKLVQ